MAYLEVGHKVPVMNQHVAQLAPYSALCDVSAPVSLGEDRPAAWTRCQAVPTNPLMRLYFRP